MAKKKRNSGEDDIEAYRHETETKKDIVPAGLASYDTLTSKPKKYEYDPHLDPQLAWTGKAENTSFEVPTLSLHLKNQKNTKVKIMNHPHPNPPLYESQTINMGRGQ